MTDFDPAQIAHLQQRNAVHEAYKTVFGAPIGAGAVVLRDLLLESGIFACRFEPGDPHRTAFNDGRASLALHILERLRLAPLDIARLGTLREDEPLNLYTVGAVGDVC